MDFRYSWLAHTMVRLPALHSTDLRSMHPLFGPPARLRSPILIALILWALAVSGVRAADTVQYQVRSGEPATLTFWNRPIVTLRAEIDEIRPRDRVERIERKIADILATSVGAKASAAPGTLANLSGHWVQIDGRQVFALLPQDADTVSGESLDALVQDAVASLQGALDARREQQSMPRMLKGLAWSLGATVALGVALWFVVRIHRRALRSVRGLLKVEVKVGGIDLHPYLHALELAAIKLTSLGLIVIAVYLWLTFVFGIFPLTQPWGRGLAGFLSGLLMTLATGAIGALPGLFTVLVIFVLQRALSDFYPEYQLVVHLDRPEMRIRVLSDLHANIQDVFNEFGVQIMSPHFEDQPAEKVWVPKGQWCAAPAREGGD
jgi:hypothetical protein